MKTFSAIVLLGLGGLVAGAEDTPPPPALQVTGITSILGDRQVLFKIFPAGGGEQSGILAEGEARGGIRLLKINLSTGVAQFDNHGVRQTISLCETPELSVVPVSGSGSVAGERSSAVPGGMATGSQAGGQAEAGGFPADNRAGGLGGAGQQKVAGEAIGATGTDAASATDERQTSQPWWYRAAVETETARLNTAAAVLRGENIPYPLTPLTPAGTDPRLISSNAVYFNHFDR